MIKGIIIVSVDVSCIDFVPLVRFDVFIIPQSETETLQY